MSRFTVRHAYLNPYDVVERIVFNANYGGAACCVPGTCVVPVVERAMKPLFFEALCLDVEKHGFRNPIVVYQADGKKLLSFGGSRLRIAKRLDMHIPAIVIDYDGEFDSAPLVTPDNFDDFFTDVPKLFEFTSTGIVTHYSLERARRQDYDPGGFAWAERADDTDFIKEEFPWLGERSG